MADNKVFQTRLLLKYDSYAEWLKNDPVLLSGEIAIATVPAPTDNSTPIFLNLPNVVMKVGDGTNKYSALPFVSGLAADVYSWAKAAEKPSYSITEIEGAEQYRIAEVSDGMYQLQFKTYDATDWSNVNDVVIDTKSLEDRIAELEELLSGADGSIADQLTEIKTNVSNAQAAIDVIEGSDEGKSMRQVATAVATEKVAELEKEDAAVAGQYVSAVSQSNGVITVTRADLPTLEAKDNTAVEPTDDYVTVVSDTTASGHTVTDSFVSNVATKVKVDKLETAIAAAQKTADDATAKIPEAINELATDGVSGTQEGTEVTFVSSVSQSAGVITAALGSLKFESAYNAETNKAATMADVTNAVADLNGAMHFVGVSTTDPEGEGGPTIKDGYVAESGDVCIFQNGSYYTEYVYDGSKWEKLGDEGLAASLIAEIEMGPETIGADSTLATIQQSNGVVEVTPVKIQIAESQVDGLTAKLTTITGDISNLEAEDVKLQTSVEAAQAAADAAQKTADEAKASITEKIAELETEDTAVDGQYVSAVSQSNGVVTVTRANLPTLTPSNADAVAASTDYVTVISGVDVSGHTVSTTSVSEVATKVLTDKLATTIEEVRQEAKDGILDLDSEVDAQTAEAGTGLKVLTKVVQDNGALSPSSSQAIELHNVAVSGKIEDLDQTENAYVVFNCGTSSVNV